MSLSDPYMGPKQGMPMWVRVDLGIIAMKEYSTFCKAPELEPCHQIQFRVISRRFVGGGGGSNPSAEILSAYSPVPAGYFYFMDSNKKLEKKLDGNYTRMLRAILNKSWRQHPTRHQLYGHLPPITKTIQVRRTRHAGHCWRSRDELISDVLLWTPTHGRAKSGQPARTYIQQLCEDTGCCPEDLPEAMNDREEWRERVRDIRASSTTWWWWWWWFIH